jgi:ABC-type dipeptide/oligopeptide/nickel transport system permease component
MAGGVSFSTALLQAGENTLSYLGRLIQGDLGMTIERGISTVPVPVSERLPLILMRSVGLLITALALAAIIGVTLGVWGALRRRSSWPLLTLGVSLVGVSLPSFFAALLLQYALIYINRSTGRSWLPLGGSGWDEHLILPALVLSFRPLAQIARVTYVTLSEVLDQDYVRTAHSKGLHPRRVLNRHVLRNAAVPILTTIGLSLRFSLSSLPIVEYFFGWQGLGFTLLKSIAVREDNLTIAMLLSLGIFFISVNLLLDLSYRVIDPRLRGLETRIAQDSRTQLAVLVRSSWREWVAWLRGNPIRRWWFARANRPPLPTLGIDRTRSSEVHQQEIQLGRTGLRRAWLQGTLGNLPLIAGGLLVTGLVVVVIWGSAFAPHSPYTTQGLTFTGGEFKIPPFPPDEIYPWGTDVLGRDMMSLILVGAQQTFLLAGLVLLARLGVGFILGAIAGWWNGSWIDRVFTGAVEVIAAFPTLLLAMIFILALNIRNGMGPFVIALCFVGWGEIMQYVRSEVVRLRPQLFIEGAIAVGLRPLRILRRHVLPNLIPALISISALEMGAVLMLLGELGFISIFIGGGLFAELSYFAPLYHYSDVPEWGALLSNIRTYARSYSWMGIYPGLAFFVSILGLNLLGEGLRRLVEKVGVRLIGLFNRYTFAAGILTIAGFLYLRGSTGEIATYRRQASVYSGENALAHVAALTDPLFEGRSLGSAGMQLARDYIAFSFEAEGLQAAGEEFSFFQEKERVYGTLPEIPRLVILDDGPDLTYREDFNIYPIEGNNIGELVADVRFVAFGDVTVGNRFGHFYYPNLEHLAFRDEILLVRAQDAQYFLSIPRAGLLVIADDPAEMRRLETIPAYALGRVIPAVWITPETADRLLAAKGLELEGVLDQVDRLDPDELFEIPLESQVQMNMALTVHEKERVFHVIGHQPSLVSSEFGGIDDHMIIVLAQYDCPAQGLGDDPLPCANNNASGVASMLETLRTFRESGYQPYRTFLFVAYSGEGVEGGGKVQAREVEQFLKAKYGFSTEFTVDAVVDLRGLGGPPGERLVITSDGSQRLANVFEYAARLTGVPVLLTGEQLDLDRIFDSGSAEESGQTIPWVSLAWDGWEKTSHLPEDSLESISVESLEQAGKTLNLALMILGREINY